nr:MAG TPA: hypothetical protein [Caudoviricetes sp.]
MRPANLLKSVNKIIILRNLIAYIFHLSGIITQ